MIRIGSGLVIVEEDISFSFIRSSGPGGQNVNKVSTAVQLRYNVKGSSLPRRVKERLIQLSGRRYSARGFLVLEARRFRTREQNRRDALDRLVRLVERAAQREKPRRPTRPTAASKRARLQLKRRRSEIKKLRRSVNSD